MMFVIVGIIIGLLGIIIGGIIGFFIARNTGKVARLQAEASNARKELREYHGKLKNHMHQTDDLIHGVNEAMLALQEHQFVMNKELEYRTRGYQITEGEKEQITYAKKSHEQTEKSDSMEAPKDYVVNKENV